MNLRPALAFAFVASFAAPALAVVTVPHSGYLLDAADAPVDTATPMQFAIFATPTGGSSGWSSGAPCSVAVHGGYYATTLGSTCGAAIADAVLAPGTPAFLEITVDTRVLTPRLALASTPAALHAGNADLLAGQAPAHYLDAANHTGTLGAGVTYQGAPIANQYVAGANAWNAKLDAVLVAPPLSGNGTSLSPIALPPASSTTDGYLTHADWVRFDDAAAGAGGGAGGSSPGDFTVNGRLLLQASGSSACALGALRWTGTTYEGCTADGWADLLGPSPSIVSVNLTTPSTSGGALLELAGSGFKAPVSLTVDGVTTASTVVSPGAVRFTAPAHGPGNATVRVVNAFNRADTLTLNYVTGYFPSIAGATQVLHVETNGNDVTGNGSSGAPYASLNKAINVATTGAAIVVGAGTFRAIPMLVSGGAYAIHDLNKALTILGANGSTIIEFFGSDSSPAGFRDASLFALGNAATVVANMKFHYYPNRGANYADSIFHFTTGTFRNIHVENKSTTTSMSYAYYNNGPANTPKVYNSTFKANGRATADYVDGGPNAQYVNCHWDIAPSTGNKTFSVTRAVNAADLSRGTLPSDLVATGDPAQLNPEGTRSNVGVGGGPYLWP